MKMLHRLLTAVLLVTLLGVGPASADEATLPVKANFHLYLLVGQSNMAGRGKVTPADKEPIPRVLMLAKDGTWQPAVDPLHFDKSSAGVGLGRTFGQDMAAANPDVTIGLIPCAVGGSPIKVWQPGEFYSPTKSHPWDDAIRRAKLALKDGTLKGILWHQGESDSSPAGAEVYEEKMVDLIGRFRKELDAEEVPFIVGQLGKFEGVPWSESKQKIDQIHQSLPDKVKNVAFVSAEGLSHKGDKVHFNADSYREFGHRYAKAYLELIKQKQ